MLTIKFVRSGSNLIMFTKIKKKQKNMQAAKKLALRKVYKIYKLKVSKSQKKIMTSWIHPKNERWGIFQYIKLPQRSFFGRIQGNIFLLSRFTDL